MRKGELLHAGKVKSIWTTADPDLCIAEFSDRITAGDGLKKAELPGKGRLLNQISSLLFARLAAAGVPSHFVRALGENSMVVKRAELLPLEVVVRNRTAGSICRRLGLTPNLSIEPPLVEFYFKNDALHDPLLTREHIAMLEIVTAEEYEEIMKQALAVNRELRKVFAQAGLELVDFKLEFGRAQGHILLIDEVSPDTCRLWLTGTNESLDKDRFRNDTGDVLGGYREVLQRLQGNRKTVIGDMGMKRWQKHGLNQEEYNAIREQMGREPNELELALFGVMWSEHCCYKHTRHLLKKLPSQGPLVVQGPGENAGVIDAGDGIGVAFKIESHNHPSAVDPFQGAATGVGGIVRDVVSMGARPFALLNSLRLGTLDSQRNRWLLRGIVGGIASYGNCLEVPTVGGEIYFASCYDNNPLVNAMCIGLVPLESMKKGTAAGPGNRVLAAGAPTGREGIAGAAFASAELTAETSPDVSEMQVGDPQAGKALMEASLQLAGLSDVVGIQDMGAAGLTSSSCEMAYRGGCGIELELSLVPTKEEGITPLELLLSESQERMLVVVKPNGVKRVQEIFRRHGLEAADIGRVTEGKDLVLLWQGEEVGRIPAAALADGVPRRNPQKRMPAPTPAAVSWQNLAEPEYDQALLDLLANSNISSRASLWNQFEHQVGDCTVQGPGASAAVLRLPGSNKGIAAAVDCNSRYCALNPCEGTKRAVAEAARNVACTGARPAAITNCLNFPSPEVPEHYWALEEAIRGMAEACRVLQTPVVSGNVSLYNEGGGVAINPTPVISMVGLLEDVEQACTIAPISGQVLVLLGKIQSLPGGSEFFLANTGSIGGPVPTVDLELEAALCRLLPEAINSGVVKAAHDVSEGGIATTLAEMALAGDVGMEIVVPEEVRPDFWLFSESPGAVVVALEDVELPELKAIAIREGVPIEMLGIVGGGEFVVGDLIRLPLPSLAGAWSGELPRVFSCE